jgi:hypothetical protein
MDQTFMALVELQNGFKVEGKITSIDKVNMKITIVNATRYNEDNLKKEFFPELIIQKTEIKEVKKFDYDIVSKTTSMGSQNIYLLPSPANRKKPQFTLSNDGFFDNLTHLSPDEEMKEAIRYNEKNNETFYTNNQSFTPQNNKRQVLNFQQRKMLSTPNHPRRNYRNRYIKRGVHNDYKTKSYYNSRNYVKSYSSYSRSYRPNYQKRYFTNNSRSHNSNYYSHNFNKRYSQNYYSYSNYNSYINHYNSFQPSYKSGYNSYANSYQTSDYHDYKKPQNTYYSSNNSYYNKNKNNNFYYENASTSYSHRGYNYRGYY